ncbi:hypothetical protein M0802_009727 [Mischocyttarus mexicanus]|nr:hypothetical protein M0802_009727 [Mischocyttarus mexicanus]
MRAVRLDTDKATQRRCPRANLTYASESQVHVCVNATTTVREMLDKAARHLPVSPTQPCTFLRITLIPTSRLNLTLYQHFKGLIYVR